MHSSCRQLPLAHWVPQQQVSPNISWEARAGCTTTHSPLPLLAAPHHCWALPPIGGHWQVLEAVAQTMLPVHSSASPGSQPAFEQQAFPSAVLAALAGVRHSVRASHQCWPAVGQAQVLLMALHVMLPLHSSMPAEGQLASGQQGTPSS